MACPVCPAAGWLGGWFGGYFGINPPEHLGGRILSAAITANLISVSVIALKVIFDVSLCVGGGFNMANIVRVGSKALVMGIVYSIGVNYILNRYVYSSNIENRDKSATPCQVNPEGHKKSGCCCSEKKSQDLPNEF